MSHSGGKSPRRAANDLTVLLRTVLGEDRVPVDVEALAREVSRNHEDPITTIQGVNIVGFEGMLRARRNLSTTLRHRRFLFTDSFLLLWKWRVG